MEESPEILAAHQARRDAVEPLLAVVKPLAQPGDDEVVLSCPGGVALVRTTEADPESFVFSFTAAHESRLAAHVDGPKAFARLLDLWAGDPGFRPGPDSIAMVTWPSRDTEMTRTLVERDFAPQTVLAVRLAGRGGVGAAQVGGGGATIRRFEERDLETVTDLWLDEIRWDAQFGIAALRPSTHDRVREQLAQALAGDEKWGWVAERNGTVVGLIVVQPPGYSDWAAKTIRVAPAAYLTCGVVAASERGGGVGTALARHVHAELDAVGIGATLLHYAAANPLSGPFWSRCGYRPLVTAWGRGTAG